MAKAQQKKKKKKATPAARGKPPRRRAAKAPKRAATRRAKPKAAAARATPRRWYDRYLASPAGRAHAHDPPASGNAAYWRVPVKARAAHVARLFRGSPRQRRLAIAIARAEQRHAEGPPRRRQNPGFSDAQAKRAYELTHWGRRGHGAVGAAGAANPGHGTAVTLGRLVAVTYETRKGSDRQPVHYEHEFEGRRPVLAFHDGGLLIVGGDYTVTEHGIEG